MAMNMDMENNGIVTSEDKVSDDVVIEEEEKVSENTTSEKKASGKKSSKKGSRRKKKGGKVRSREEDNKKTAQILIAIIVVGVCLLIVSIVGMIGASRNMKQSGTPTDNNVSQTLPNSGNQTVNTPAAGTTAPITQNVQGETPSNADSEEGPVVPQTDAQWLEFFNTAVNKLKNDGPSFTKSKQTATSDIQLSNTLAQAYVSTLKDKFLSDETVKTEVAKGDTAAAVQSVSPDGAAYVSTLTMNDIKSIAYGLDASGNYVIRIEMNDATSPTKSDAYGKIFEFMVVDDVMNTYAPDIGATVARENVALAYSGCYAEATITPDGKVVSYQTYVGAHMILKSAKISVVTTDLDAALVSSTTYSNIVW